MAFRRIARAALLQLLLLACGLGLTRALQAHVYAAATVLALTALWIGAETAWRSRSRPALRVETPREIAREAVQARMMASLLDQAPTPLVTLDEGGALRARNRAARQLFRTDDLVLAPPAGVLSAMQAPAASGRTTVRVAQRTYTVSRSELWGGRGRLTLAALLDIEPDLRTAEARALRELMQVLSHEIMNGLTPVASLAATVSELLAEDTRDADRQAREALAVLSRRAEGLARFADGYRSLARLPAPTRAPTSLAALVEDSAQLFRSRWTACGVTLSVAPTSPDLEVAVDRDQLMQALSNLLTNAAEAALAGPPPRYVNLACEARRQGAAIRVGDSGQGVPAALQGAIFQPFFTTKTNGTGVGLSLSRQIARAHGGELDLRAAGPGQETVFELRLEP